ncbi:hypothetical protein Cs7R123_48940 [Catellatospora sp. TT07R-123]|uniref:fibronectin type III domain-containing protein n=1 Tax=Catellatospora sp. TT07R-123 TaxID=2733863 RepID=UPI001B199533|nr:fibronectin type III domain-containing protein [Catellatospora sp. TT07R-123]GHJ47552.1 hypothetical protein Cs7R123_48940 [Catellatospora sp. TT07R-123]
MGQPLPGSAQQARNLVLDLGRMLSDITSGRDVAEVHQRLLDQFDAADHDSRIDAMEVGRQEFAETWTALREGRALPVPAWEQVVLPTIVTFSDAQYRKSNLELATSTWLAARAAVDAVPDFAAAVAEAAAPASPAAPAAEAPTVRSMTTNTVRTPIIEAAAPKAAPLDSAVASHRPRRRRALLAVLAIAASAAVVVALLLVNGTGGKDPDGPAVPAGMPLPGLSAGVMASHGGTPVTLPTAPPTASPQPMPVISGDPTPAPVWSPAPAASTGPGASAPPAPVAPSAPTGLTAVAADEHAVWLAWSEPADAGTGGIAYYRILQDGEFIGWTRATSATITGLAPGTSYTFAIVACNAAGLLSPPSGQITAMTASPPSPAPSTAPASPSPAEEPSPTPPEPSAEPPSPTPAASPSPEEASPQQVPTDPDPA